MSRRVCPSCTSASRNPDHKLFAPSAPLLAGDRRFDRLPPAPTSGTACGARRGPGRSSSSNLQQDAEPADADPGAVVDVGLRNADLPASPTSVGVERPRRHEDEGPSDRRAQAAPPLPARLPASYSLRVLRALVSNRGAATSGPRRVVVVDDDRSREEVREPARRSVNSTGMKPANMGTIASTSPTRRTSDRPIEGGSPRGREHAHGAAAFPASVLRSSRRGRSTSLRSASSPTRAARRRATPDASLRPATRRARRSRLQT